MAARRAYRLGRRTERTALSRQRIVGAALELFRTSGFHDVTFDAVARRAEVGRTTVFQLFGSKRGLLRAVEAEVSRRAGVDDLLVAVADIDATKALEAAFRRGAMVWGAEREMFRRLFGQATVDPDLHAIMGAKDTGRRRLCDALAGRLKRQHALRPGMTAAAAARRLWLLTSFHAFDALANGDSPERTGALQWKIAADILLAAGRR